MVWILDGRFRSMIDCLKWWCFSSQVLLVITRVDIFLHNGEDSDENILILQNQYTLWQSKIAKRNIAHSWVIWWFHHSNRGFFAKKQQFHLANQQWVVASTWVIMMIRWSEKLVKWCEKWLTSRDENTRFQFSKGLYNIGHLSTSNQTWLESVGMTAPVSSSSREITNLYWINPQTYLYLIKFPTNILNNPSWRLTTHCISYILKIARHLLWSPFIDLRSV